MVVKQFRSKKNEFKKREADAARAAEATDAATRGFGVAAAWAARDKAAAAAKVEAKTRESRGRAEQAAELKERLGLGLGTTEDTIQKPPDRVFLIAHFSTWCSPRATRIALSGSHRLAGSNGTKPLAPPCAPNPRRVINNSQLSAGPRARAAQFGALEKTVANVH